MKLYEISNEFQKVVDLIENCDEITPELIQMLDEVSEKSHDKVLAVGAVIKNFELASATIDIYINRQMERQSILNKKRERLEDYLKYHMDVLKLKKVESPEFDVTVRTNQYALDLFDQSVIPKEYFKTKETVTLARQEIIKDLKVGCEVPGARFVTTKSVSIK